MPEDGAIQEVVADKGYHSTATMKDFKARGPTELCVRAGSRTRGSGKAISKAGMPFTRIGGGFVERADVDYCE